MTKSDGTSIHVELLGRDVEHLLVRNRDGREGLVDFEFGDLIHRDTRSLEGERNRVGGGDGEVNRSAGGIGEG